MLHEVIMGKFYTDVSVVGNNIAVRGFHENGEPFMHRHGFEPWYFVTAKKGSETSFKTIDGKPVDMVMCNGIYDFRDKYNKYAGIEGFNVYGLDKPEYLYIYENYQDVKPDFKQLRVAILDIEVSTVDGYPNINEADSEITAITIQYPNQDQIFVLGYKDFKPTDSNTTYLKCGSEFELMQKFYRIINHERWMVDVWTGWNIEFFDIPYIVHRTNRIFGNEQEAKKFSPWRSMYGREIMSHGKPQMTYFPKGVAILDYLAMYKKFVGVFEPQETYRLDHIAYVELGERKLDYCVSPDTKILRSDLSHISANELKVGDELLAFDEYGSKKKHSSNKSGKLNSIRRTRKTKVVSLTKIKQPCYKIITNQGEVISSENHRWLASIPKKDNGKSWKTYDWIKTKHLKIGDRIPRISKVWSLELDYDSGWLAGILDGEGYVSKTSIGISQKPGKIFNKIVKILEEKGYKFSVRVDDKRNINHVYITSFSQIIELLGKTGSTRLIENLQKHIEGINVPGRATTVDTIISIEYVGEMEVIGIGTEHKTIIANGLMSHNSEYGSLQKLYEGDHQKFMEYNVRDCDLIRRIDQKRHLLDLVYIIAYDAGVNYMDALGTTKSWDVAIHNYLLDRNIVVPKFEKKNVLRHPVGGFVKDPIRGMHEWVVSFDLQSLYPHLIMAYNIGPDTYRGKLSKSFTPEQIIDGSMKDYAEFLEKKDVAVSGNFCLFDRKEVSFLSQLMKDLFAKRKIYKKKMLDLKKEKEASDNPDAYDSEIAHYDTLQYSMKVRLNSAYGALANQYFRWFSLDMAEAVTTSGQLTIKWAARFINDMMNKICDTDNGDYIIAIDTDSVYVDMGLLVKQKCPKDALEFLDKLCEQRIQPFLDKMYQKLSDTMNCKEQAMFMKREAISDRGVFVAKKRYMLNVLDNEGVRYHEPDLKIMGLECVRSSTPSAARDVIKEAIRVILQEDEASLHAYFRKLREQHGELPFGEIAFNSSVNNLTQYADSATIYGSKSPIYYRGALLYNHYRKIWGLDKSLEEIFEGEKVKYTYLRMPNPINENVIALPTETFPTELGLERYIDYDKQFDKSIVEPMRSILDTIGWTERPVNTLGGHWENDS